MNKEFGHIYIVWRKSVGSRRHVVGVLKRNANLGVRFEYADEEKLKIAFNDGFIPYTEFPETNKLYEHDVLSIFAQRLMKSERADIGDFLRFWEVNDRFIDDKFYLLAHTQGLSPIDNFEFLADFNPIKKLCFVSELAGLSHLRLTPETIQVGDRLRFELEPTNKQDKYAVQVFKGSTLVGYVKKIHSKVFYKNHGKMLNITVKAIDFNGIIKRVFVRISF